MDPLLVFTFRHVPLVREQERQGERERKEEQISSDWSARERERDLK